MECTLSSVRDRLAWQFKRDIWALLKKYKFICTLIVHIIERNLKNIYTKKYDLFLYDLILTTVH